MKRILFALLLSVLLAGATPNGAQAAWFSSDKSDEPTKPSANAYELISQRKDLSRFADMISSADLKDLFRSGTVTVFAPTDDAIGNISGPIMKRIKSSKENLQSFVRYHVINGSHVGFNAINERKSSAATANGESIIFDGTKSPAMINDARLVLADLQAGQSVVHTINAALIPASIKEAPAETAAKPEVVAEPEPAPKPAPAAPAVVATPTPVAAPVPTTAAVPVSTSAPAVVLEKTLSSKAAVIGTSAPAGKAAKTAVPIGTAMPLGSAVPTGTAAAAPVVETPPPAEAMPPKSKGFMLFGHKFGGD